MLIFKSELAYSNVGLNVRNNECLKKSNAASWDIKHVVKNKSEI